jgi:ribonuclease P protein component
MSVPPARRRFPKSARLLKRAEFRGVYDEGQRRNGSYFAVFFRPNGLAETRLGVTVPVRIGGAVIRNRVKRRIREAYRLNRERIPQGWDIVMNPREAAGRIAFRSLEKEMMRLFPSQAPPAVPRESETR